MSPRYGHWLLELILTPTSNWNAGVLASFHFLVIFRFPGFWTSRKIPSSACQPNPFLTGFPRPCHRHSITVLQCLFCVLKEVQPYAITELPIEILWFYVQKTESSCFVGEPFERNWFLSDVSISTVPFKAFQDVTRNDVHPNVSFFSVKNVSSSSSL